MINRECGVFHSTYASDMQLLPLPLTRWTLAGLIVVFFLMVPLLASDYFLNIANLVFIAAVGAIGLNILVGYTGQVSIGHGAFIAVGAYAGAIVITRAGLPFWIGLPFGGLVAAVVGAFFGIPSLRIKGLYLAIATLAAQFIIEWLIIHIEWISGGAEATISVPKAAIGSWVLDTLREQYYLNLAVVSLAIVFALNLARSPVGRAFIAIRDRDVAAEIMGIHLFRYKLLAFAVSSFYAGVTGVLYALYLGIANYEQFDIATSVDFLAMIIIGGLGSILGSILGAMFITVLPMVLRAVVDAVGGALVFLFPAINVSYIVQSMTSIKLILFGLLIIVFLIAEPDGLNKRWRNIRDYFRVWPYSY
jgi:branched-chain amino acid transport system permease protein